MALGYTRAKAEDLKKNFFLHLQPKKWLYTKGVIREGVIHEGVIHEGVIHEALQ